MFFQIKVRSQAGYVGVGCPVPAFPLPVGGMSFGLRSLGIHSIMDILFGYAMLFSYKLFSVFSPHLDWPERISK